MTALDSIREYCLSLPAVTENVQWEDVLLFRVGGKIFPAQKETGLSAPPAHAAVRQCPK